MISMGSSISRADATGDPGVAGCLLQFPDEPEKLFVVTASHVLVATKAQQFDRVVAKDLPGQTLGVLFGWTDLSKGPTTADAAAGAGRSCAGVAGSGAARPAKGDEPRSPDRRENCRFLRRARCAPA